MADLSTYDPIFKAAGDEWGVDPRLLKAIATQESGGNARVISKAGAQGLMQIIPATQKYLGVSDPNDPVQSIYGAAKYINEALEKEGSAEGALLYYHGGPGWRQAYGPESKSYVPAVTSHYVKLAAPPVAEAQPTAPTLLAAATPRTATDANVSAAPASAAPTGAGNAMPKDDPLSLLPPAPKATGAAAPSSSDDPLSLLPPAPKGTTPAATATAAEPSLASYAGAENTQSNETVAVPAAVGRIGRAAVEGYQGTQPLLTPEARAAVSAGGPMGRFIVNPLLDIAGVGLAGLNAIGTAGMQGVVEGANAAGVPALGRDINMLSQVVPAGEMVRVPMRVPGGIEPGAPSPRFVQEYFGEGTPSNPLAAAPPGERPAFVPPGVNIPPRPVEPPAFIPPSEPSPVPRAAQPEAAPAAVGGPQPSGAQVTPSAAAQMTPEQIATQRTVADKQWLNQTQQPGVRDTTEHIPGITSSLVEQEQTVTAARELKALKNLNPELSQAEREILDRNTELRKGFYGETVGSDVTRAADLKAASDKIETDLAQVWRGKGEADPASVHAQIETELAGSAGDLPPLKSAMKQVSGSLENAGTDPQAMYRTHRLINYLQSRQGQLENPGYGAADVQAALTRVKRELAQSIDNAATGFGKAMSDYSGARGPIDAAKALQDRENGLYDSRGHMSFLKVHALLRDIIDAQKWDAPNDPLAGVSDAQMTRLKALHDDLKKVASAKDLATAQGSDTAMNAVDIAKAYGKLASRAGIEGAANMAFGPGVGSMIVRGAENLLRPISSGVAARRQVRRGMEILQPPPNPLQQQPPLP